MEHPVIFAAPISFAPVISFAKVACTVQLSALQRDVDQLIQNPWVDHVNKNDYVGAWDVMPLRCQREHLNAHPILQGFAIADGDDWENLPVLEQCPAIESIFNQLQCPIKAARLMRLKSGAEIKPHRDHQLSIEFGEARLHVPIHTSDWVSFIVDNKTIPMRAGELWYFNADQIHEVYNRGAEDRINLVIDCVANEWLCEQIRSGALQ
jgi:Aspartyl/Asparaginyl beta-hydroxylase